MKAASGARPGGGAEGRAVSVVVPAYNAAATIERAIRSALDQTLDDLEVLVVDDGSSDGTAEIARRLSEEDDRVVVVRLADRGGVNRARNAALDRARGRWIAVLDADDWYDPERLDILLRAAGDRYNLIADNQFLHEEDGPRIRWDLAADRVLGPADIVASKIDMRRPGGLGMLKPVIRKALLDAGPIRYVESVRVGGDFVFLMDCLARSPRLLLVSRPLYHYRLTPGSLTRSKRRSDILTLCREYDRLRELPWGEEAREVGRLLGARRRNAEVYADYHALIALVRAGRPDRALALTIRNPRAAAWVLRRALGGRAAPRGRPDGPAVVGSDGR